MINKKLLLLICSLPILHGCDSATVQGSGLVASDTFVEEAEIDLDESEVPVDYGNPGPSLGAMLAELPIGAALPNDGRSHIVGEWSSAFNWPLSPIHIALLPNGTVLTYGPVQGLGSSAFDIDRWSPSLGFSPAAHNMAPTGIDTNIFCSAQTVMPDGNVLISGGDRKPQIASPKGIKNEGIRSTTLYNGNSNMLSELPNMHYPRWYPTLVTLGSGRQLTLGGRAEKNDDDSRQTVPTMPEVYNPKNNSWNKLTGAENADFYRGTWFYPRAFLNKRGNVTVFSSTNSDIFELNARRGGSFAKVGSISNLTTKLGPPFPAVMYKKGEVLLMERTGKMHSVNIEQRAPSSVEISQPEGVRYWANTTVLADGKVLLVGGAKERQKLDTAIHYGEIWDPDSDTWQKTRESTDRKARLYHSVSLLLPDATVLVAGGGPPGPVANLNADVFYPPYLFKTDGSGDRAMRPEIEISDPLVHGNRSNVVMVNNDHISRVTLVKSGSATHSFDSSQRLLELDFTQAGNLLSIMIPRNRALVPPGLYMLFAINDDGVPSEAKLHIVK